MRWRYNDPEEWHAKFAWLPTRIGDQYVWLETYERKLDEIFWGLAFWHRRLKGTNGLPGRSAP